MLLTVEIWQIILPQGRQAPHSPQALVRAAHLTHGGVAHGAGRAESIPSDRKWIWEGASNHSDNPAPVLASLTLPLKTLQQTTIHGEGAARP